MRNIVAVDDSPYSTQVIEAIGARRWPVNTEFKVLSVVEPIECSGDDDIESATNAARHKAIEHMCGEVRHKLQAAVPDSIVHFEVRKGVPTSEILASAIDWSADRILIGARGRHVCPHNLLGSVSRSVAQQASCTVEVVRPRHSKVKVDDLAVPI